MREFAIGAPGLSFLGACFFYAYAMMQIPAGLVLYRFGIRKLLSGAIFISETGATLFGLTSSFALAGLGSNFSITYYCINKFMNYCWKVR